MEIVWAITGAGDLLKESITVLEELANDHVLTIITSRAANEVLELYGLDKNIQKILLKNPDNSFINEYDEKYSFPFSGKLAHSKSDLVVISPTTANTTAKIVNGIADTLVTNVAAQSGKGLIPLLIVPVDQKEGVIDTVLPAYIDEKKCKNCNVCLANLNCPVGAIDTPNIDLDKCIGCKKCRTSCIYKAVEVDKVIQLCIRKIDADNTRKLDSIENVTTIFDPKDIPEYIKENF